MHLGIPALLDFYRGNQEEPSLVLATIIATEGSTYRKPGAMMLVNRQGGFEGMISGGCLEGDLLHHAEQVFSTGQVKFLTYDMHADEELVWSLGLGCDGVIHLMLQRLDRADDFGFIGSLHRAHEARRAVLVALATDNTRNTPVGSFALLDQSDISVGDERLLQDLTASANPWPDWRFRRVESAKSERGFDAIQVHMPVPIRVLICGAGPDAIPMARVFGELDWQVVVADHRPAFARKDRFPGAFEVLRSRPERLGEQLDLASVDAAVIMSHHLENDSEYLKQISSVSPRYLGVLGPRARRDRLIEMADCAGIEVHGPVGLDIGAELPAAIALSVAAEAHAVLNGRDGRALTRRADEKTP